MPRPIQIHPAFATALLRTGLAAAGRVWLLGRLLDTPGRGMLPVAELQSALSDKNSPHYICGKRQLRNLLRQGAGLLWTRDKRRIWLFNPVRAAAALGVGARHGRFVQLPSRALHEDVQQFRAYLYAAFHAGREGGKQAARPIARETIQALTGVPAARQREYERIARIRVRRNLAIGPRETAEAREDALWRQGSAVFTFYDSKGKQGRQGQKYLAWQLPNSYDTQLTQGGKHRRKRKQQRLTDLSKRGKTGNGGRRRQTQRYFPHGAAAGRAYDGEETIYWPGSISGGGTAVWQAMQ